MQASSKRRISSIFLNALRQSSRDNTGIIAGAPCGLGFEWAWLGSIEMTSGPMVGPDLFPFRFDLGAHRLGKGTSGMQSASARNVGCGGDVVLQHHVLALDVGMIGQGGAEQRLRIGVQR